MPRVKHARALDASTGELNMFDPVDDEDIWYPKHLITKHLFIVYLLSCL